MIAVRALRTIEHDGLRHEAGAVFAVPAAAAEVLMACGAAERVAEAEAVAAVPTPAAGEGAGEGAGDGARRSRARR